MASGGPAGWWSVVIGFCRKLANLKLLKSFTTFLNVYSPVCVDKNKDTCDVSSAACQMDFCMIERKLVRLVSKLEKYHNISLEIFKHEDIQYGQLLGKGGEAEVHRCIVMYKNIPVEAAVKTVLTTDEDAISITLDEVELLCLAHDPIISTTLKVFGVAAIPDVVDPEIGHLVIVTEAGLMNALQLFQEHSLPLTVTLDFWKRLAMAVYIMHCRHILHQDIKPENIIITAIHRNRQGHVEKIDFKIIDLGMGRRLYVKKIVTDDILGTDGYHPPEVLHEDGYDFRADIFMLGITFSVLLHPPKFLSDKLTLDNFLKEIHLAKKRYQAGKALFEDVIAPTIEELQNIPPAVIDMICRMLERQDRRKITLQDIIRICGNASEDLTKQQQSKRKAHPLSARPCNNCRDSGFGSGGDGSKRVKNQRIVAKRKRSKSPSPRKAKRTVLPAKKKSRISLVELRALTQAMTHETCVARLRRH